MSADPETEEEASSAGLPSTGDAVAGKYLITHKLDEGGMGVLFAATHRALNQPVAIKFLKPKYARDAHFRERFLREARAAASIRSEHAARIQDVDETRDGIPFIVMELLRGSDLGKLLAERGKLPFRDAVGYVLEACEAIAEAHAAGLVHRDLKPSNLFLAERPDGTMLVKVLDFGISKSVVTADDAGAGSGLTAPNTLLGSPQYMSPEQVCNAKTVDLTSDVWALGIILYELVGGVPPFDADSAAELFAKILTDKPPPLKKLAPDVPPGLSDVVLRCLVKDPPARTKSVADLALALRPFAPSGSEARIDTIVRVLARSSESLPSPARTASVADTMAAPVPVTVGQRTRVPLITALGVLALLGLGCAVFLARPVARGPVAEASTLVPPPLARVSTAVPPPPEPPPPAEIASARSASATSVETGADAAEGSRPAAPRRAGTSPAKVKDLSQIHLLQ